MKIGKYMVPVWALVAMTAAFGFGIWYFFFNDDKDKPKKDKPKDVTVTEGKKKLMFMPGVGTVAVPEEAAYN